MEDEELENRPTVVGADHDEAKEEDEVLDWSTRLADPRWLDGRERLRTFEESEEVGAGALHAAPVRGDQYCFQNVPRPIRFLQVSPVNRGISVVLPPMALFDLDGGTRDIRDHSRTDDDWPVAASP